MKIIPKTKSSWILLFSILVIAIQTVLILHSKAPQSLEKVGLLKQTNAVLSALGLSSNDPLFQLSQLQDRSKLKEALQNIDEYSSYLDRQTFESFSIDSKQEYEGIGVTLLKTTEGVEVREVFDGGPANKAGILAGDLIVKINGWEIKQWDFTEIIDHVRGSKGSHISVKVKRSENYYDYRIRRGSIDVPSVEDVHLTKDNILYLQITQFGDKTAREFLQAVSPYVSKPLRGLVIDLRENTGGIFQTSLDILDAFYERGEVMLQTKPREKELYRMRKARFGDPLEGIPTVVLMSRNSASASEVVAGSLQSTGKATIIGEQSLGKGSIQTVYSLRAGDAYKKTTSYYYLPNGTSIHEVGITPDLRINFTSQQYRDYQRREAAGIAPFSTQEDPHWERALQQIRSQQEFDG